jgi:SAM-dependent methyltransferase
MIDSARTCVPGVFAASGEKIDYACCTRCGFVFTRRFDAWSEAEMAARIYNADYVRADPDFLYDRPRFFATALQSMLGPVLPRLAALDFGGGAGLLARMMREAGCAQYDSYDPFLGDPTPPAGPYTLVTAFEVFEHSRDPIGTLRAAISHLTPDGALVFSTLVRPSRAGPDWWYIAPRNGHVSIHTEHSLRILARRCGAHLLSLSAGLHLLYRRLGAVTRQILRTSGRQLLYHASLRGPAALARHSAGLVRAGLFFTACDPRHVVRAMFARAPVY